MMLRADQRRASYAFQRVQEVSLKPRKVQREYRTAVMNLGPSVLRIGLAAVLSTLQGDRDKDGVRLVLDHLSGADIHGLVVSDGGSPENVLPDRARTMATPDYMLATREFLKLAQWLRRAAQAYLDEP